MDCVLRRVLCAMLLFSPTIYADIFAGKSTYTPAANTLMRFTDDQSGNVAPAAVFGGNTSALQGAQDMAWLQESRELYIADFTGQAIRVYNTFSGDAAAVRTITDPLMGQPRHMVLLPQYNELIVITYLNFVSTYPLDGNGAVAQTRRIGIYPNPVSGLNNPFGLAYNPATDEIYVGDYQSDGGTGYQAEVLVFPRTASGDVAPTRVIAGGNTLMGTYVTGLVLNLQHNELYVLTDGPGQLEPFILSTFAANSNGDVAPLRRISGNLATLYNAFALAYDPKTQQLIVASERENSGVEPGLLFFPRTANGNVAPSKVIRGPLTGTSTGGDGWFSVLPVDLDFLFGDGYE
jgi:hypothetical protein